MQVRPWSSDFKILFQELEKLPSQSGGPKATNAEQGPAPASVGSSSLAQTLSQRLGLKGVEQLGQVNSEQCAACCPDP